MSSTTIHIQPLADYYIYLANYNMSAPTKQLEHFTSVSLLHLLIEILIRIIYHNSVLAIGHQQR